MEILGNHRKSMEIFGILKKSSKIHGNPEEIIGNPWKSSKSNEHRGRTAGGTLGAGRPRHSVQDRVWRKIPFIALIEPLAVPAVREKLSQTHTQQKEGEIDAPRSLKCSPNDSKLIKKRGPEATSNKKYQKRFPPTLKIELPLKRKLNFSLTVGTT